MLSLSSSLAVEYECFVEMLSREEGKRSTQSQQQQLQQQAAAAISKQMYGATTATSTSSPSAAVCVTQTLLNGLARYAGRYLQKMHLLPSTAAEVNNPSHSTHPLSPTPGLSGVFLVVPAL